MPASWYASDDISLTNWPTMASPETATTHVPSHAPPISAATSTYAPLP